MKTLMMSTALALALGLSTNTLVAPIAKADLAVKTPVTQMVTSMVQTNDFYQGDYLTQARGHLNALKQSDLYTGKGASESTTNRWVTDF